MQTRSYRREARLIARFLAHVAIGGNTRAAVGAKDAMAKVPERTVARGRQRRHVWRRLQRQPVSFREPHEHGRVGRVRGAAGCADREGVRQVQRSEVPPGGPGRPQPCGVLVGLPSPSATQCLLGLHDTRSSSRGTPQANTSSRWSKQTALASRTRPSMGSSGLTGRPALARNESAQHRASTRCLMRSRPASGKGATLAKPAVRMMM